MYNQFPSWSFVDLSQLNLKIYNDKRQIHLNLFSHFNFSIYLNPRFNLHFNPKSIPVSCYIQYSLEHSLQIHLRSLWAQTLPDPSNNSDIPCLHFMALFNSPHIYQRNLQAILSRCDYLNFIVMLVLILKFLRCAKFVKDHCRFLYMARVTTKPAHTVQFHEDL